MLCVAKLSVATTVGGCGWPVSDRAVHMEVNFGKFSNSPPNSASMIEAMTLRMMIYSTCMGPFSWRIFKIGVFYWSRA